MDVQTSDALRGAPKYLKLREAVRSLIADEGLQAGHLLPSEIELRERFSVSRGTIRRAFDDLERDGVVSREPGRGTFVATPRMERPLPELTSFSEHIESLGMSPGAELVSFREVRRAEETDDHFPAGTPLVRIVRTRTADQRPVGLHTLFLPAALAERAGVTARALRADPALSVYRALASAGVEIDLAREGIAARRATAQEARRLALGTREPVLEVLRRSFDIDGGPVEVVRAVYRADRYDYVTWLRRPGAATTDGPRRRA